MTTVSQWMSAEFGGRKAAEREATILGLMDGVVDRSARRELDVFMIQNEVRVRAESVWREGEGGRAVRTGHARCSDTGAAT